MAISIKDRYPSKVDTTDAAYPQGKARNVTVSLDGTGTPFEKDLVNDIMGFQQAIYKEAGITPSGTPDTADVSQQLDGLKAIQDTRDIADLAKPYIFDTVALMQDTTITFLPKKIIHLNDRNADFIVSSAGTANNRNVLSVNGMYATLTAAKVTPKMLGWTGLKADATIIKLAVEDGLKFEVPAHLTDLKRVSAEWHAGNKYPIAFFGDSTVDGAISTSNGVDEATLYNNRFLSGGVVPDGFNHDHDETEVPNCFVSVLQKMGRDFYRNSVCRVYNAGWRGQRLNNGWARLNSYNSLYNNPAYSDVKWVCLDFGINDSNNSSTGLDVLISATYSQSVAIVLDAFARGVQPALAATNPIVGINNDDLNLGHNEDIVLLIDTVKRQIAKEFNLEFLELGGELYKWISTNRDGISSDVAIPDDTHLADLGHIKQAEIILCKYIAKDNIIHFKDSQMTIDGGMPMARAGINIGTSALTSASSLYGANSIVRQMALNASNSNSASNTNVIDAFVWCEKPSVEVCYNVTAEGNDPSLADIAKIPTISVTSYNFSKNDYSKRTSFSATDPSLVGGVVAATPSKYIIGGLQYGLNRLTVFAPAAMGAHKSTWSNTSSIVIGGFTLHDTKDNMNAVIFTNNAENVDLARSRNTLKNSGLSLFKSKNPASGSERRQFKSMSDDLSTNYSLNAVGDAVDIDFIVDQIANNTGVIVASYLNGSSSFGTGYDKNKTYRIGGSLLLKSSSGSLYLESINAGNGSDFGPVDTSITNTDVNNKTVTVTLTLVSRTQLKFEVSVDGVIEYTNTTASNAIIRRYTSGIVGGFWNSTDNLTGVMTVKAMSHTSYKT